jgi:hypothetical protein
MKTLSDIRIVILLSASSITAFLFRSFIDAAAQFYQPAPTPSSVAQFSLGYALAAGFWLIPLLRVSEKATRGGLWGLIGFNLFLNVAAPLSVLAVFCPPASCTPDWHLYNPLQYASILIALLASLAAYLHMREVQ